jgi:translocation and assembly module TamB
MSASVSPQTSTVSPPDPAPKRRGAFSSAMRGVRWVGTVVGTLLVFVLSLVVGLVLHAGTPPARRAAVQEVNAILAPSFQGTIRIEALGGLGIFGLSDANLTIDDPHGQPVVIARGARVRVATLAAIRSLLGKNAPLTIELSEVALDTLDLRLDSDANGQLDLAEAFAPKTPSTTPADPHARGIRIVVSHIAWRHAWAHGQMTGAPLLDVDLDDFRGAFEYTPDFLEGDIAQLQITARRIAQGSDVAGSLKAHVRKPSDPDGPVDARLAWQGAVAGIAQSIQASLADKKVDAVVDVPDADPVGIRALWPASSIAESARAHIEAHGTLPAVDVALRAGLGEASFDATGRLSLGDGATKKEAKLALDARNIDVHQLAALAPVSRLGLTGEVHAELAPDGAVAGDVDLRFLGGKVATHAVPAATIRGQGTRSAANVLDGQALVVVDEPGAPTQLAVRFLPRGKSSVVAFELQSKAENLEQIPELEHAVHGGAEVWATGELDLGSMAVDARVKAHVAGIAQGTTKVAAGSVDGFARGPVASPHVELQVLAQGIDAGTSLHLASAKVDVTGDTSAAYVTVSTRGPDTPDLDANASVGLEGGVSLDALRVALARAGERSLITARKVTVGGGGVRVDGGRIEGIGAPMTADVAMTPGTLRVRATTKGLDLARVGRVANLQSLLKGGTLAFDTDLQLRREGAAGRVTLDLSHVGAATVKDASAHLELTLDGRSLVAKAHADAMGVGSLDLAAPKVELGTGGPLSVAAWRNASGAVDIDARADLAQVMASLPPDQVPVEARGKVHLQGHVARDDARDLTPELRFSVTTDGLDIAQATPKYRDIDGVIVYPLPAWHIVGLDFIVNAQMDGNTGLLEVSTQVHDTKAPLAQVDVDSKHFPYGDVFHDSGELMNHLRSTAFDVHVVIPERGLGTMPAILQQPYLSGKLAADIKLTGTMRTPAVDLTASLRHGAPQGQQGTPTNYDLDVTAHYDGLKGTASVKASTGGHDLVDLEAQGEAAVAQFLDAGDVSSPKWKASAKAHLAAFPLASIHALDDKLVSGLVSGDVSITGLHDDASADAALVVDPLNVGTVTYKAAHVTLKADGHALDATVRVDQTDGFAEVKAHALAAWGGAMAPALDRTQPLQGSLSAKKFRIAALLPFLGGTLDELDGRLDADARVSLDPNAKAAQVSGTLALTEGKVEAAAGGGEFHDMTANVKVASDGTVTLEKLTAKGLSGAIQATGSARLAGASLQSAKAVIVIPSRSPIPLSTDGVEVGNVDGRIEVSEVTSGDGKMMDVKVEVPQLRVALPEGSSTNAQALGTMDKVRIGAHRGDARTFALLPLDPAPPPVPPSTTGSSKMTLEAHLGEVEVTRGTQLKIDLAGNVNVSAAAPTSRVTGQIHLKSGGTLDVQGKKFVVQEGTVTFVGSDPSNPEIIVKAGWTAPDATVVIATFDGPLKTGKVTLSSEPTLSQQEIVELLVFGAAGGTQAQTPQGTPENSAIGTAGGQAAQPLNHALSQLGLGAVSASIDTTQSANPRPEVEVQIAKDISLQIAVVLGQPPPGVNPDHTLLTVDWRFLSRWSLASTVGDAGTTIFDLLWQKRY